MSYVSVVMYILGKWTRQWSERYFVLTSDALHWFKKERGAVFGEERGTW